VQATLEDFFKALRGSDFEVSLNAQIDARAPWRWSAGAITDCP